MENTRKLTSSEQSVLRVRKDLGWSKEELCISAEVLPYLSNEAIAVVLDIPEEFATTFTG